MGPGQLAHGTGMWKQQHALHCHFRLLLLCCCLIRCVCVCVSNNLVPQAGYRAEKFSMFPHVDSPAVLIKSLAAATLQPGQEAQEATAHAAGDGGEADDVAA